MDNHGNNPTLMAWIVWPTNFQLLEFYRCAVLLILLLTCTNTVGQRRSESESEAVTYANKLYADNSTSVEQKRAVAALRQMGVRAIPAILDAIRKRNTGLTPDSGVELMAAMGRPAVPLLGEALGDESGYVRYAAAEALEKIGADAKPAMIPLIKALEDSTYSYNRAARTLAKIGAPAVPALMSEVTNSESRVRHAALGVLENIQPEDCIPVPALIKCLDDDSIRRDVANVLSHVGPRAKAAVPRLIKALADEDKDVRESAVRALGGIGLEANEAVPSLLNLLQDESKPRPWNVGDALTKIAPDSKAVHLALIHRLEERHLVDTIGTRAVPALLEAIRDEPDADRRRSIGRIFEEILEQAKPKPMSAIPPLMKFLEAQDEGLVEVSRSALVRMGSAAIPALSGALRHDGVDIRLRAVETLRRIGGYDSDMRPSAIVALSEAVTNSHHKVRLEAVEALGTLAGYGDSSESVVSALTEALKDEEERVGAEASMQLAALGSTEKASVTKLIRALKASSPEFRQRAAVGLGEIGPKANSAVPALIESLGDNNADVRSSAAIALGLIGPAAKAAVPALIKAMDDRAAIQHYFTDSEKPDRWQVRDSAIGAMGGIGREAKAAIPRLITILKTEPFNNFNGLSAAAENAAYSLGKIGAPAKGAIPTILEVMNHQYAYDYRASAQNILVVSLASIAASLKESRDISAIPTLRRALSFLEDGNYWSSAIASVQRPLEYLQKEAAERRGPPPTQEEIARCWNLVVQIESELNGQPFGSGIIFGYKDDRLYIATAKHVVRREPGAKLWVRSQFLRPGETLAAELAPNSVPELDLAVLIVRDFEKSKFPLEAMAFDRFTKPQNLQANEKVYALGLPITQRNEPLASDEFVEAAGSKLLFRSKTVREGYSGGALFNSNWQLIGMIRADEPPFAHAIGMDQIVAQLKEWGYPVSLNLVSDNPFQRYQAADLDGRKRLVARLVATGPEAYKTLRQLAEGEEDSITREQVFSTAWHHATTNVFDPILKLKNPSDDQLARARSVIDLRRAIYPDGDGGAAELIVRLDALRRQRDADELFALAFERLEKLTAADESNPALHNNVAWLCAYTHRKLDAALKHSQIAVGFQPESAAYLDTLAEVQFQLGKRQSAIETIKKAIQFNSDKYFKAQLKRFEAGDTSVPIPQ